MLIHRAFLFLALGMGPALSHAQGGEPDHDTVDRIQRGIDLVEKSCPTPGPLGACVEFRRLIVPCPEARPPRNCDPSAGIAAAGAADRPSIPIEVGKRHGRDTKRLRTGLSLLAGAADAAAVADARRVAKDDPQRGVALENALALARIHALDARLDEYLTQVAPSIDLAQAPTGETPPSPQNTDLGYCTRAWMDGNQAAVRSLLEGHVSALDRASPAVATVALARIALILDRWAQALSALEKAHQACAHSPAGKPNHPLADLAEQAAETCVRLANHAGTDGEAATFCRQARAPRGPADAPAATGPKPSAAMHGGRDGNPLGVRDLPTTENASFVSQHETRRCLSTLRKGGAAADRYKTTMSQRFREGNDVDVPAALSTVLKRFGLPPLP